MEKKQLDGEWIPVRLTIAEHLNKKKKMTPIEATLFFYYLVRADHISWEAHLPIDYLVKALGWDNKTVIRAKKGLIKKNYIRQLGQTGVYILKMKKYKEKVETEITAPYLEKIEALEKRLEDLESRENIEPVRPCVRNSGKYPLNSGKYPLNSGKYPPLTREIEKTTTGAGQGGDVVVEVQERLLRDKGAKQVSTSLLTKLNKQYTAPRVTQTIKRIPKDRANPVGFLIKALEKDWELLLTPEEQGTERMRKTERQIREDKKRLREEEEKIKQELEREDRLRADFEKLPPEEKKEIEKEAEERARRICKEEGIVKPDNLFVRTLKRLQVNKVFEERYKHTH